MHKILKIINKTYTQSYYSESLDVLCMDNTLLTEYFLMYWFFVGLTRVQSTMRWWRRIWTGELIFFVLLENYLYGQKNVRYFGKFLCHYDNIMTRSNELFLEEKKFSESIKVTFQFRDESVLFCLFTSKSCYPCKNSFVKLLLYDDNTRTRLNVFKLSYARREANLRCTGWIIS